jgi:nicotinamidase-related amidase
LSGEIWRLGAAYVPGIFFSGEGMTSYITVQTLAAKTDRWLERIAPHNRSHLRLNRQNAAILVIDMQNHFVDPAGSAFIPGTAAILPNIVRMIHSFRNAARPVIFTKHVHHPGLTDAGIMAWWWDGMCLEGSMESEIHPDLRPAPEEKVILKHRYSAFYNTDLETVLRCLKIEDLVITGVMTNMCCESTARDAYYRDHRVFFTADATAALNEEMHLASLLNLAYGFASVTTAASIIDRMKKK